MDLSTALHNLTTRTNLVIQTDMAFVDVALLDVYNDPILEAQRRFVKKLTNCEDILLNFVGTIGEIFW